MIFVTGHAKNVGKTTCLNMLAARARAAGLRPALISVGYDGERQDHLYLTRKPAVPVWAEDRIVSSEQLLRSAGIFPEFLETLPDRSAFGQICVVRAQRAGNVQLLAPEGNAGVARAIEAARQMSDVVLVDGAINRMTQVASWPEASFLYVARADAQNFESTMHQLERLQLLLELPVNPDGQAVEGPLTRLSMPEMMSSDAPLYVSNFTQIFLQLNELRMLLRRRSLGVTRKIPCAGVVLWLCGVSRANVEARLGAFSVPLFANPYEQ